MQPALFDMPIINDIVSTPPELARDMVDYFMPVGICLDPCRGSSRVFFHMLPPHALWCEISEGKDFYSCDTRVDWIIGNPPFSHYSAWLRHSMMLASDIVYLMPVYKVFASDKFLNDLFTWGGIVHIRRYGTGTQWGMPFGHALAAVHYQQDYTGSTSWSKG